MKILKKEFKKKDGTTGFDYRVGILGARGFGIALGDKLELKVSTVPQVKKIDKKDGTGSFNSIKVLARPVVAFENFEPHPEYGTASFQLPDKYVEELKKLQKGDVICYEPVEFDNKVVFNVSINGKRLFSQNKLVNNSQVKLQGVEKKKEFVIPEGLAKWVDECITQGPSIVETFGNDYPAWYEWTNQPDQCGTDYFLNWEKNKEFISVDMLTFKKQLLDYIKSKA